jgi:hypothetical protein
VTPYVPVPATPEVRAEVTPYVPVPATPEVRAEVTPYVPVPATPEAVVITTWNDRGIEVQVA